ncbi:BnaCnng65460D, partial [Brassica napus]
MPAPTTEAESIEPQSLKKLSIKSLKRALDHFSPVHGQFPPPDAEAKKIRLSHKDSNDYSHSVTLSLAPDTTNPNRFVVDHNLTSPRVGGYVLQNLCGFMCYSFINKPRIYNPATRQLVTLPAPIKSQTEEDAYGYYFGYDPVIDQ